MQHGVRMDVTVDAKGQQEGRELGVGKDPRRRFGDDETVEKRRRRISVERDKYEKKRLLWNSPYCGWT